MWTRRRTIGSTIFETARLRLEPLVESHAVELFDMYSDPRMFDYIPQDPPQSLELLSSRYKFLSARQSPEGDEGWFNWAVREMSLGTCIGCIQITLSEDERAKLAYEIGVPFWRQGYATEACTPVIAALFESGVAAVWAELDTRNHASIGLLERLGFTRGALRRNADFFKGAPSDEWTYFLENSRKPVGDARNV